LKLIAPHNSKSVHDSELATPSPALFNQRSKTLFSKTLCNGGL
jgi:hypothetical protein